ncbi:MAG: hypothetical protein KGL60_17085 [Pseudomonas sp.]|jgi:hypothetical protein|uniref:hypothetical protein n=1 Tax=unclassified Pseudomonas TaxID=196821 RepID=UPI0013166A65|nr:MULTISPECIES: hypothetical protein [unclassified Pseudomonas]MDP9213061.1 hypothetical protein [Pseudomonadota bacterium]MDE1912766.1 hypothetical protein [Pseudomonas sp.]MDE2190138.1 hypothetical protein [Pseudomonas sp.]MDE2557533.1 hypothetical protein [Pseudomonas sp.]MDP9451515.1 hypothetical protein [Pseudomonadota bacterium]
MTELSHGNEPRQAALIQDEILDILKEAKVLAHRFYRLTGKPLGVKGEVAEYEAATRLGLLLHPARQAGYDATETLEDGVKRIQIKGRCILNQLKITGRMGAIDLRQPFDTVLLVLLDCEFNAFAMYEASRAKVEAALTLPGSKARNERGALAIRQFMSIATLRWARHEARESENLLPS